jgi:hypothetical protein
VDNLLGHRSFPALTFADDQIAPAFDALLSEDINFGLPAAERDHVLQVDQETTLRQNPRHLALEALPCVRNARRKHRRCVPRLGGFATEAAVKRRQRTSLLTWGRRSESCRARQFSAIFWRMLQKRLDSEALSPDDLNAPGDFFILPNRELTESLTDHFLSRATMRDLLFVVEAWFGGQRRKQEGTFAMMSDLGQVHHLTLPPTAAARSW